MSTTKEKIILSAIKLFNHYGIANVRLQQVANETGISVGNMAYHYRNKEAILEAVMNLLFSDLRVVFSHFRKESTLNDFNLQLDALFGFMQQYPFYFLDFSELQRSYPAIHAKRCSFFDKMISQIKARLDYQQQRGILSPPSKLSNSHSIAQTTWMLMEFWLPQQIARQGNAQNKPLFKQLIWAQFTPYLTNEGWKEFNCLVIPTLTSQSN